MCSSKPKLINPGVDIPPTVARINGRPVLQPTCNRVPSLERRNSLKKLSPKSPAALPTIAKTKASLTPPISPKSKSQAIKIGNEINGLNSCGEKVFTPRKTVTLERNKSKKISGGGGGAVSTAVSPSTESSFRYSSSLIVEAPGTIAAVRREQMALSQAQRKLRIAHYGRTKSGKFDPKIPPIESLSGEEEKRCTFITPNSDPLYVAYHDEEWGVPVHDDKMLFELLVLSSAQFGSDWTSILKKRQDFRNAFSGFDAETIANFTERQMISISADYGIDLSRVRGVVDNSNRILEIKREFGSLNKYMWGFVNHKPISSQYKSSHKIPVKTSKSESISKDMVRRGFRFVGPTVIHSFMQAAGLTNDHLITCHRHLQCTALADQRPTAAPAL